MKTKRDTQIQIKIHSSEKDSLEALAEKRGLSLSELMRRGAWFYGSLDDRVFLYAEELSKRLNIKDHVVISNTVLRRLAEDAAAAEVSPGESLLYEFPLTQEGVIGGARLFEMIKENRLEQLRLKKGGKPR